MIKYLKANEMESIELKFSEKEQRIFTYIKGIAIFLVIFDHTFSYYSHSAELSTALNVLLELIRYVHIPVFFILGGLLCHRQDVGKFYKKKLERILVPFWFFTVLKLIYSNLISNEFAHADSLWGQLYDAFVLGESYWFAYAICVVYLVMPIFWRHDEKCAPRLAIIGTVVSSIFNILYYGMHWHFMTNILQLRNAVFYLPFFLLGYIIRCYYGTVKRFVCEKKIPILLMSLVIVLGVIWIESNDISVNLFAIKMLTAAALISYILLLSYQLPGNCRVLSLAGKYSWQIMLLDAFYKAILFALIAKFINISTFIVIVIAVLDFALGIISSVIAEKIPGIRWLMGLK